MSRVKSRSDRGLRSRFRRVPQIESLETRAAAGDLLVGLGSAAVASQGSAALAENVADEAFRQQGLRFDTEYLDRWIAGEEAGPRSFVRSQGVSLNEAPAWADGGFATPGPTTPAAEEDGLAPAARSGFGLPKIIKELRDGGLSPQPEEDFFNDFDGIFPPPRPALIRSGFLVKYLCRSKRKAVRQTSSTTRCPQECEWRSRDGSLPH